MFDVFLYGAFPYLAFALAVGGGLYRYYRDRFSFSSLSSQLLDRRQLFWGSVPWHYGIVILLIGHLIGWVIPDWVAAFNGTPVRLYILEITAFGLALFALAGIVILILRRLTSPYAAAVTTRMDAVLLFLLLVQVLAGLYTAIFQRWGSLWYLSNAVPYLDSLVTFRPQINYAQTLPLVTQIHVVNAFLLLAIFPFSRLVHIFTFPITYLWRPYQTVVWNRRQREIEEELP
ncbi:MAG: respiratory nitrate reductase subunit gamma [Actinobacteria bacterium]|nr:respiratory nitrate reductase subunit gamma [Actinomycetota bacterium]